MKNGTEFDYTLISMEEQIKRYTAALLSILANPASARRMGKAGKHLIETEFEMSKVVKKFISSVEQRRAAKSLGGSSEGAVCRVDPSRASKLNEEGK